MSKSDDTHCTIIIVKGKVLTLRVCCYIMHESKGLQQNLRGTLRVMSSKIV